MCFCLLRILLIDSSMKISFSHCIRDGDLIIAYGRHDTMKAVKVCENSVLQNRFGVFKHSDWIGKPFGSIIFSNRGGFVYLLALTPELWTLVLSHRTQILYIADISFVIMYCGSNGTCVYLLISMNRGLPELDIWTFEILLRMYAIREWKMDHSKLLCNHVPTKHTCYSRILKSHPSSDCNFRFTVNPLPRIRQHNGEIVRGAWRTKSRQLWEMVVCIYGFPTNVSALQFEWAWQHPQESAAVRQAAATFKSFSGVTNKIKLAYMMLVLPAWQSLNITVNYFSTKYTNHSASCPSLPEQMKVKVSPMDELPFYTEPNEFECKDDCDNLDEYDEVSGTCETVPETYPNEVVIVSADNLHSIIHEACHEQSEHIEEYGTRKPGKSSDLGVGNVESLVFFHPPPNKATSIATGLAMVNAAGCADMSIAGKESLRGMRFKYTVEADEDPQPSVKEKPPTTVEEYEKLGDTCTFGVYHRQPFDVICSPVRALLRRNVGFRSNFQLL
ncbi:uncharacterized protein LOC108466436 isoform X1 [Gossypium arboreum]|uniref:uncharacterized protein LOC108466436 isoform X1 n=3 Tax=Gossypium arboreum TaxID=29729 RepID=UPI0008194F4A|nr:uncharacterized protein LOC108466436 isoform X1 [Gossypium arboreum]XP_052876357.1 uncharacterized protein LOC108466436 isoform X1 [Gossypium arboreum]XP_052876358.1 uncharacterized protein LOC108466436 isoform X1 [Gossypium arboreum]XP_052876359.1 uncharacterized protein LOC108466436 isoform X1 [Gossypium arboreum]